MRFTTPLMEGLEPRLMLSGTIHVDCFEDVVDPGDGLTSLREAITQAAADPGDNTIDLPAGLYELSMGQLMIDDYSGAVDIVSLDGEAEINALESSRVFEISYASVVSMDGLIISGGYAETIPNGGGILNSGELTLNNCMVMDNSANIGGGIFNDGNAWLWISNSTIAFNNTNYRAGGLANYGNVTIENSTISENTAYYGGGIFNLGMATATVTNCTISENVGMESGGGIMNWNTLYLDNTIVAGNYTEIGPSDIENSGEMYSRLPDEMPRNNFIGEPSGGHNIIDGVDGNIVGYDPMLEPLDYNGGRTLTHAIDPLSLAVNAGSDDAASHAYLMFDQRGEPFDRFIGPVDIGAFELQTSPGAPEIDVQFGGDTDVHGYDFGNVIIGQGAMASFTVHNTGDDTLRVSQAGELDQPFEVIPPNGGASGDDWLIEPGYQQEFTVRFTPSADARFDDVLRLYNNDTDESIYDIGVVGDGVFEPDGRAYYEVWGGNTSYFGQDNWEQYYYNIDQQDYVRLGGSNNPDATSTFAGEYDYYVVATRAKVQLDAVRGWDGAFGHSHGDGNTHEYGLMSGSPDGQYAEVGFQGNGDTFAGFVVVENPAQWQAITLYTGDISTALHVHIHQEVDYEGLADPAEFDHWIGVWDQGYSTSMQFQAPSGVWYDMWVDQDGGWDWEFGDDSFNSVAEMTDRFGDGTYVVQAQTPWGTVTTDVWYGASETADPLAWPTQIPQTLSVIHGQNDVPVDLMLEWQAVDDPAVTGIHIRLEDPLWQTVFMANADPSETSVGPVTLDAGANYAWAMTNDNNHWYVNADGYGCFVGRGLDNDTAFRTAGGGEVAPDLAIDFAIYEPGVYQPGDTMNLDAQLGNIGQGNAIAFDQADQAVPMWNEARLSRDTIWGNADDITVFRCPSSYWMGGEINSPDPEPWGPWRYVPEIPEDAVSGQYYIAVMMDTDGQIAESDETNNLWWSSEADVVIDGQAPHATGIKHVLSVGVRNPGVSYGGDVAAGRVHNAFTGTVGLANNQLLQFNTSQANNRDLLIAAIETMKGSVQPGDAFIFYIAAQVCHDLTGDEVSVDAQYDTLPGHWENRRATTGDEYLYLSTVAGCDNYLSDDDFSGLFLDPVWAQVQKIFIVDSPYAGGFIGATDFGDSGDLSQLGNTSVLAAAREANFAYMLPEPALGNLGVNTMGTAMVDGVIAQQNEQLFNVEQLFLDTAEPGSMLKTEDGRILYMGDDGAPQNPPPGGDEFFLTGPGDQNLDVQVGTGGATYVRYSDPDGSTAWVTMAWGSARLNFIGNDLTQDLVGGIITLGGTGVTLDGIEILQSKIYSSLSVFVSGGDGLADIGWITGSEPMGTLSALGVNLTGEGIAMTGEGYIAATYLHNILDGADIVMPGQAATGGLVMLLGTVGQDVDVELGSSLRYFSAVRWDGGTLTAPRAVTLLVRGGWHDGAMAAGDFGANLTLTGQDAAGYSLYYACICGSITGGQWNLAGDASTIYVLGEMTGGAMNIAGNAYLVYAAGLASEYDIAVGGDMTVLYLMKGLDNGSVNVGGKTWMLYLAGDMNAASIHTADNASAVYVLGDVKNNSTVHVARDATTVYFPGEVTNSALSIGGNTTWLYVGKNLADSTLDLGGKTTTLHLAGRVDRSRITASDSIVVLYVGALRDSTIFCGVAGDYDTDLNADGVLDLPAAGDLAEETNAEITYFYILGVPGGGDAMVNSNVAAHGFGYISLNSPQLDNDGTAFGILAGQNGVGGMTLLHNYRYYYWLGGEWTPTLDTQDLQIITA